MRGALAATSSAWTLLDLGLAAPPRRGEQPDAIEGRRVGGVHTHEPQLASTASTLISRSRYPSVHLQGEGTPPRISKEKEWHQQVISRNRSDHRRDGEPR